MVVSLKYLGNFWKIIEMPFVNWEVHLQLNWSANFTIANLTGSKTFVITDAKHHILVVTLPTQDNIKLLECGNQNSKGQGGLNKK